MEVSSNSVRVELWKLTFARSSFHDADRACRALLNFDSEGGGVVVSALSTAAIVYYARPFKQNDPVRLSEAVVPTEYLEFHRDVIAYRDQVLSDRDGNGHPTSWDCPNDVVFCSNGRSFEIETTSPLLDSCAALKLGSLSVVLSRLMDEAMVPLLQQLHPAALPAGRHVLHLDGEDADWREPALKELAVHS